MLGALRLLFATPARASIALAFALNSTVFANWFARIPAIQTDLGLGEGALGLALLGMPVGSFASMPIASLGIARVGAARMTYIGAILCALAIAGPGMVGSFWGLFAALFVLGLTNGTMDIAMNTEAAHLETRAGVSLMSGFHAMWSLGGVIGAGLGSLGAVTLAPDAHLATTAVIGALIMIVAGRALWRLPAVRLDGPTFAWPSAALMTLAVMSFCILLGEGAISDWAAVYLARETGAGPALAGFGFGAFAIGMTITRLYGDRLIDRFGGASIIRIGGLVAAAGLTVALIVGTPVVAMMGFATVGLGFAVMVPTLFGAAARTPGLPPGTSVAAVASFGYAGALGGPAVIGLAAEGVGLSWSLGIVVVLTLIVVAMAGAVPNRRGAAGRDDGGMRAGAMDLDAGPTSVGTGGEAAGHAAARPARPGATD